LNNHPDAQRARKFIWANFLISSKTLSAGKEYNALTKLTKAAFRPCQTLLHVGVDALTRLAQRPVAGPHDTR
jgi:hypothetical protein